jgi:hypothetical protein
MTMAENPPHKINLELLNAIMSPHFQNHDRQAVANKLRDQFMKDPELLSRFEHMLGAHKGDLAHLKPSEAELKSFGWSDQDVVACPAAVVAAAAATWAAAAAQKARV